MEFVKEKLLVKPVASHYINEARRAAVLKFLVLEVLKCTSKRFSQTTQKSSQEQP